MAEPVVSVRGLGKRYGMRRAVASVSLDLHAGEMIGLVGANGGGKTTTLRMLAGLTRPDEGTGTIIGADIRGRRRPLHALGYLAQQMALYPELTVAENWRLRCDIHRLSDPAETIAALATHHGLHDALHRRVGTLSGGWARRAHFAATVIHAPRLLLLDEPTAGLDPLTCRTLWGQLGNLAASGCAIIVATHDLVEASRFRSILHYRDGTAEGPISVDDFISHSGSSSLEAAIIARAEQR